MKYSKIPLTTPPLYLKNNLASTDQHMAYLSYNSDKLKLNVVNKKNKEVRLISIDDQSIPTSIQYMSDQTLIVTTMNGYYIYSENGQQQHHKLRNQLGDISQYFIGATLINPENQKPFYAIGFENKIIFVDQKTPKQEFFGVNLKNIQPTCLTSYYQYLIYGDSKGYIHQNKCLAIQQVTETKSLNLQTKDTTILSISVLEKKDTETKVLVIVGDFIGRLTVVDLMNWEILCVINSHIKPVTTLAINQQREQFLSGSDDTFINIWKLNQNLQPQLIQSHHLDDTIIVGITSDIFVAAYDQHELIYIENN
ncbi:unnamed protein product (macronuclear) [Paramecium tetraurelia]|uniref:Uncharacterized protein n=1 Tax=Paramecium tetraurelia TaxID=5888 RepID=A0EIS1_PARTE|nr:uncharacterized protein GSPATT00027541001 [Paramecium tetraurelia]CAK95212.1 unnamed protein product [Paramecium tetraurelia]|eukprot:XP_001462585.1 hypothetical protein (macronuclear) [Paramecium tetraurelia strain d4-2]